MKELEIVRELEIKIKELEKENASLRECISSVLTRVSGGYDGYNDVDGLKYLIDNIVEILESGYPERLTNYENRECCPLCFQIIKENNIEK